MSVFHRNSMVRRCTSRLQVVRLEAAGEINQNTPKDFQELKWTCNVSMDLQCFMFAFDQTCFSYHVAPFERTTLHIWEFQNRCSQVRHISDWSPQISLPVFEAFVNCCGSLLVFHRTWRCWLRSKRFSRAGTRESWCESPLPGHSCHKEKAFYI